MNEAGKNLERSGSVNDTLLPDRIGLFLLHFNVSKQTKNCFSVPDFFVWLALRYNFFCFVILFVFFLFFFRSLFLFVF